MRSDVFVRKSNAMSLQSLLGKGTDQKPSLGQIREEDATGRNSFPKVSSRAVAYWLLGSAASIFGIVVFGGLTRLTESGCVFSCTSSLKQMANVMKLEHNRMEARNGIFTPHE
jgi:hypothetical protein